MVHVSISSCISKGIQCLFVQLIAWFLVSQLASQPSIQNLGGLGWNTRPQVCIWACEINDSWVSAQVVFRRSTIKRHAAEVQRPSKTGFLFRKCYCTCVQLCCTIGDVNIEYVILVGGLEHFLFFHTLGMIFPTDSYFSEGLKPPTSVITLD